jgi:hypothetical protein
LSCSIQYPTHHYLDFEPTQSSNRTKGAVRKATEPIVTSVSGHKHWLARNRTDCISSFTDWRQIQIQDEQAKSRDIDILYKFLLKLKDETTNFEHI